MLKNYFKVYKNGTYIGSTKTASLKEAKAAIKLGCLAGGITPGTINIGTHMGSWKRMPTGYLYSTTVGAYIDFVRFAKEASNA